MKPTIRIAFRVDSSIKMGSGHLMRCLTLANKLREYGAEICFVTREHSGHMIGRLDEASYSVCTLPPPLEDQAGYSDDYAEWLGVTQDQDAAETITALNGQDYDWLVVDHYGLDIQWEARLRPLVKNILVIDDLANRLHDCNVLIDQNYFGATTETRYKKWVSNYCKRLLGPRFALIHSDYALMRNYSFSRNEVTQRVLVFFGASDQANHTKKLLEALNHPDLMDLVVDVVIGVNHPDPASIASMVLKRAGANIHQNLPSLINLMVRADLFIGAGGATTWERMALGLPSLVISIAENQRQFTHILTENGFQFSPPSGSLATTEEWSEVILYLRKNPLLVKQVVNKVKELVDGQGVARVVRIICGGSNMTLNIRYAEQKDEGLLLEWVNDTEVRRQSFCQEQVHAEKHAKWFSAKLSDPNCIIFIGEDETGPVGQVRFEIDTARTEALISISIKSSLRGMGLSSKLLNTAMNKWMLLEPNIKLVAEVRDENTASQLLFIKLKFTQAPSRRTGSKLFEFVN